MIVIPMAGMSSRFFRAGYEKPKYMLEAHGKTLFEHSVSSFKEYFDEMPFLFIIKDIFGTAKFVEEKANKLGIKDFSISIISEDTRGQAETVAIGLRDVMYEEVELNNPITVFNIDTFRPEFKFPENTILEDGYLEVFEGEGDNWSFAKPKSDSSLDVEKTAEKKAISNLCSTGLYHFKNARDFLSAFDAYEKIPVSEWDKGELYIAPLYNYLILNERKIKYHKITRNEVVFCGIPEEYIAFKSNKKHTMK